MEYAIYGRFALNSFLSVFLEKNGDKFDIIDKSPKSIDVLNEKGATVV